MAPQVISLFEGMVALLKVEQGDDNRKKSTGWRTGQDGG